MNVVATVKGLYLRVIITESGRLSFWVGVLPTCRMCIVVGEVVIYMEQCKPLVVSCSTMYRMHWTSRKGVVETCGVIHIVENSMGIDERLIDEASV
jgi:hypothetical protein